MVKSVITARIDDELLARLRQATDRNKDPYAPTMTQMIERGAALALAEYERRKKRAAKKGSIEAEQRMALAGQTSNEAAVLRTNFAAYLVAAYKADPVGTAQACDERIDQTGRLLGIVRRMADERQS